MNRMLWNALNVQGIFRKSIHSIQKKQRKTIVVKNAGRQRNRHTKKKTGNIPTIMNNTMRIN